MAATEGNITPGGNPGFNLETPPFSKKAGSMDSGGNQPLLKERSRSENFTEENPVTNPFGKSSKLTRSPTRYGNEYEKENFELRRKLCEFEKITTKLSNDYMILKKENEELRKALTPAVTEEKSRIEEQNVAKNAAFGGNVAIGQNEYVTDSDELNSEVNWVLKKKKQGKKRRLSKSPFVSPEQIQKNQEIKNQSKKVQQPKPPPVIVNKIENYNDIRKTMDSNQIQYQTTMLSSGDLKVNVPDEENYRKLTLSLNEKGNTWYSYEDKRSRPIKVVAKKLHPSCKPEEIKEELLSKNLKIKEVTQILKRKDKTPLSLFMLTFEKDEDIQNIYQIRYILNMKVEIEALRKSRLLPQCKKCQSFGHTQNYCNRDPRCVKCAAKHSSKECTKTRETPAKCVNCGESHPANYRGCIVARELQKMRNNNNNKKDIPKGKLKEPRNQIEKIRKPAYQIIQAPGISYAEVAKGGAELKNDFDRYSEMLQTILNRMDEQEQKQEKAIGSIIQRLTKLENSIRTAPVTHTLA